MTQIAAADMRELVSLGPNDGGHDGLLTGFMTSAEAQFQKYLRRDLNQEFPEGWPEDVKQALRLQVSFWYHQSFGGSGEGAEALHPGAKGILEPYRNLAG